MDQLIMRWRADLTPVVPDAPDWGEFVCRNFNGTDEDIDKWLGIVRFGLTSKLEDKAYFEKCMYAYGELEFDKFFIVEKNGDPAATLAVICNYEKLEGYIHMVACKPDFRGQGVGTRLNVEAVRTLFRAGMKTARLTTDDFRIPAIKSYLRAGFFPDIVNEVHRARWDAVMEKINKA
ncbi:MAG: GNAT family N-acetyltransferase [Clostridia bacterium]|nr:GNAT family N-acetyltransferase [Clostridia bacterium]